MTKHLSLYPVLACAGFVVMTSFGTALAATMPDAFPVRPVRLVLGFPPGGGSDAVARTISPKLHDALGQPWVIDNRPGAAGNIATEIVTQANPDGYTVLMGFSNTLTANPTLYKVRYNVIKDLQPVINIAVGRDIVVLNPSVKARSLQEFIDLAKAKPGVLNYGSSGIGSSQHLDTELFMGKTGINLVAVHYKGGGPSVTALLAGEVQVSFASLVSVLQLIKTGRLVALAVTGTKRAPAAPDIPTIAELGFPGLEVNSWYGFLVPAKTPNRIVKLLYETTQKVLQLADVREQYSRQGLEVEVKGPEQFAAQIKAETEVWAKVIKAGRIRVQ